MKTFHNAAIATLVIAAITCSTAEAASIVNSGFESPNLVTLGGSYTYNPAVDANQGWTFAGNSGVARSVPGFSPFDVVGGTTSGQYGFLQLAGGAASISQTFTIDSAGLFQLSYIKAGRALYLAATQAT